MTNFESQPKYTNHLIHETSPYLHQHAHNPVNWFAWNERALQQARDEDKPILLSIGYSACHWCHVMAHESFEDLETAQVMNDLFVNIKVDREERPDLDKIYQFAHQVLTQRGGGWPLTVILTPHDRVPFFAGTYFPKTARQGMPSFIEILHRVEGFYRHRQDDIHEQNSALIKILNDVTQTKLHPGAINSTPLDEARHQLEKTFDELYGGFGEAPKFPHPTNIERLLRHWAMTQQSGRADTGALDMALTTLKAMAHGGIYDQLGGGFCRYSVDQQWIIPHFEKMLYDNGPLLDLFAQAGQATGDVDFKRISLELGEWVMNEMQSSEGGYFSSIDADSEGEEGRFYVWDKKEVQALLNEPAYTLISHRFGLDRAANFEGHWHFYISDTIDNIARQTRLSSQQVEEQINNARQVLYRIRDQRIHPGRDEKILTAWNGLMIKGMASAGRRLQRSDFIASAQRAVDFIYTTLWQQQRLLATYKDGKAHLMAYLDDYVFLIDGLLELLQAQWRDQDLAFAVALMNSVLTHFEDKQQGGFFFTADDHESLIQRPKVLMDEAIPAGNGVAAYVLIRLGHLVSEPRYLAAAERTLKAAWSNIVRTPYAHNALLLAAEEYLYPTQIIILRGEMESLARWLEQCNNYYAPRRFCVAIPNTAANLPVALNGYQTSNSGTVAYVCEGDKCLEPVYDLNALIALL